MECESRLYLERCKCIMYYMPSISKNASICGRSDDGCLERIRETINAEMNEDADCDCLPACNSVDYDGEVSSAPIFAPIQLMPKLDHQEIQNISAVQVFFRENSFRGQKREELIGFTEFLCG